MTPKRLVDYFVLVGLNDKSLCDLSQVTDTGRLATRWSPSLLSRYPADDHPGFALPSQISMFCFPHNISVVADVQQPRPHLHTFVNTEASGTKTYGVCVTFYERLVLGESAEGVVPCSGELAAHATAVPRDSQCSTTFSLPHHHPFAAEEEGETCLYAPKCISILSHWPFIATFDAFLLRLYEASRSALDVPLERIVVNFIAEVPLPPPGRMRVKCSVGTHELVLQRPAVNDLPLSDFSFRPLFQYLSLSNVLALITCILLEKKVVLLASSYEALTPVAEAACALCFPFYWQHVYIPVLPTKLSDMLYAPVPFLMGMSTEHFDRRDVPDEVVIFDLERDDVLLPPSESLPSLPERERSKLVKAVKTGDFYRHVGGVAGAPLSPRIASREEMKAFAQHHMLKYETIEERTEIRQTFFRLFTSLFRNYRSYLRVGNPEDLFDFQGMLRERSDARKFLVPFFETQCFHRFVRERVHPHAQIVAEVKFFDESIRAKLNRSRLKLVKEKTPFLLDETTDHSEVVWAPKPPRHDLTKTVFKYDCFPRLSASMMHEPKIPPVLVPRLANSGDYVSELARRMQLEPESFEATLVLIARLQALVRGVILRKHMRSLRRGVAQLQGAFRVRKERRFFVQCRTAAKLVQARWRMRKERQRFLLLRQCALVIQCVVRTFVLRRRFVRMRAAAIVLKSALRAYAQRQEFLRIRRAVIRVQATYRMWRKRRAFLQARRAAILIQSYYRGVRVRREVAALAAIRLASYRSHVWHLWKWLCVSLLYRSMFCRAHSAATITNLVVFKFEILRLCSIKSTFERYNSLQSNAEADQMLAMCMRNASWQSWNRSENGNALDVVLRMHTITERIVEGYVFEPADVAKWNRYPLVCAASRALKRERRKLRYSMREKCPEAVRERLFRIFQVDPKGKKRKKALISRLWQDDMSWEISAALVLAFAEGSASHWRKELQLADQMALIK